MSSPFVDGPAEIQVEYLNGDTDVFETDRCPWVYRDFLCVGHVGTLETCDYVPSVRRWSLL